MNVYDFDDTIYAGDSTQDFFRFLYKRHPLKMLQALPLQAKGFFLYLFGIWDKTMMKSAMYTAFRYLDDIEEEVRLFWQTHQQNIKPFYLVMHRKDDVIISASPVFLLEPMTKKLGIQHLIASQIDPQTGACEGRNCHGEEKIKRFEEAGYHIDEIERFYSDSLADKPLAQLAREAFMVRDLEIISWQQVKPSLFISRSPQKLALVSAPAVAVFLALAPLGGFVFALCLLVALFAFLWRFYDRITTRPLKPTVQDGFRFIISFLPFFLFPLAGMKSTRRKSAGIGLGYGAAFLVQKMVARVSKQ